MRIVTEFEREVRVLERDVWIPLACGERLAARIWLPADAEARPVPALLEYLPYRKRDMTRAGDEPKQFDAMRATPHARRGSRVGRCRASRNRPHRSYEASPGPTPPDPRPVPSRRR